MGNKRRRFTQEEKEILLTQCKGQCPICHKIIRSSKKDGYIGEIAHIFPLNPVDKELKAYDGVPLLSTDINSLDNVIILCPNCHTNYDKYPTKDNYMNLIEIKKKMIEEDAIRNSYSYYTIENEIKEVIDCLTDYTECEPSLLEYDAHKIDQKLGSDFPPITKMDIKKNICDYYQYIRDVFKEIDSRKMRCFDQIATQIKNVSISIERESQSKEAAYDHLCKWLIDITGKNATACRVVIAFFIQNCEIFDVSQ